MRRTSGGGRKIFTSKEVKVIATTINVEFGTRLVVEGGGPLRVTIADRLGNRLTLSDWMTRSQALAWLSAFEHGLKTANTMNLKTEGGES